ncbi:MAG: aminotransferase class IV [Candidatus Lambdaproteobacteria bacterium]|nr:aminotransferase class IV [Candidatus Lambdaproteobacteria bacterium]
MTAKPRFAAGAAFVDGAYVPIAEARIPITDWGFTRSDVTYDVVSVWNGAFFRLEDHLARFAASVAGLRMQLPLSRDGVSEILTECVRLAGLRNAYVEMVCTRGVPAQGNRDPRRMQNRFFAFALPFIWIANEEQRRRGLHLVISSVQRIPPASVDPTIKNFHWGDLIRGLYDAYDRGGETAVLVDAQDHVTEGPGFNVFAVSGGRVKTPARGVLEGITRKSVIELCALEGLPIDVAPLPAQSVRRAEEVFITSTAGGIMPVTTVDGQPVGEGKPGPLTTRLNDLYWKKKEQGWHATPIDYA